MKNNRYGIKKTLKKIYYRDMDSNKRIPLSDLIDCTVIFTPEDLKEDIELPARFSFCFCLPLKKRGVKDKIKTFFSQFRKWEGKIDKKTATFSKLYIGHDRRRKNRDVDIEYIKVNGVDYTPEGDEIDNAVHQHMRNREVEK